MENSTIKDKIGELGWFYHIIGMTIPQNWDNLFSGHIFPFTESWEELQISYNLICFGLYKQAFVSLRSALELGMLSVYYNINDEGHKMVKDWLSSKDSNDANTPRADVIWKVLLTNDNIKKFDIEYSLKNKFKELEFLHNYVHTKGNKYSNKLGRFKSNSQTFEPDLIDSWINTYEKIASIVCTLHLLKYPLAVVKYDYSKKFGIDIPSFGGLETFNIEKIRKILPDHYVSSIEKIAEDDIPTQETIREIKSFPDKTDEEVEEQVRFIEKMIIEGCSFKKWLKQQKKLLILCNENEFSTVMLNRIEYLKKWSVENDFYDKTVLDKYRKEDNEF
ncbi:hypothetical protein CSW08_09265 [Confluentibacter flavum]|uniref:Uncharacterized protein n=1 Tax=Confluentibacter flavum TaxID=1909700 RepID=A0A2N3HJS0_9FLAO|nr:hypothetical protein CSW08_09265 [Confluentibacter flavum]